MNRIPKVAIGLPVYNGENYLPDTLDHLLRQTFEDFELIISDNCSTDRTEAICREYAARDARILYTRTERNIGAAPNFNHVFGLARSPYFTWKAHDDRSLPAFLETCVTALDADPGVVLAHTASVAIDDRGEVLPYDVDKGCYVYNPGGYEVPPDAVHIAEGSDPVARFTELLDETYFGMHVYGLIRRGALLRTQLFRTYLPCERCLLSELALKGRFLTLPERLYARRVHAESACFMSRDVRFAYDNTSDSPYRHSFPRIRAYLNSPLRSEAIGPVQKLQCVAQVALATGRSRWAKVKRRLPLGDAEMAERKTVYQ
jgi:glycosyltransferase involved in cell wall biosynthesis